MNKPTSGLGSSHGRDTFQDVDDLYVDERRRLKSERESIYLRGGGRLKPEGALFEISLSVGLVGLELGPDGGRLFPASRIASIGARLMSFKAFKDIRFDWPDVRKVERWTGWVPWDRGVRFELRDGGEFVYYSLLEATLQEILDFAEAHGTTVEK